jgi:hypothetical protein
LLLVLVLRLLRLRLLYLGHLLQLKGLCLRLREREKV